MSPGPPRLAVAVSATAPDLRTDWPLLRRALTEAGLDVSTGIWTEPAVPWSEFDLVLANGAWDNIHHPARFLDWADRTAQLVPIVNSPATLRWNLDKHYLSELAAAGVATVPTAWHHAAEPSDASATVLPEGDVVVKPTISGGGFQTARYRGDQGPAARAHVRQLLEAGRDVMVQPYQEAVDAAGEAGLIFLGGRFSHAIRKGPLLRTGLGPQTALWALEQISPLDPSGAQLDTARGALAVAEHLLGPTTYARVDLVPLADGRPAVLELELLDPALFFETRPAAAVRFAQVLSSRIGEAPVRPPG